MLHVAAVHVRLSSVFPCSRRQRMPFDATSMLKLIERINRAKVKYPRERTGPDGVAMAAMSSVWCGG